ncbi:MAG: tRNA pseudouridine(38-40) synthase TruA [Mycobacteriales bacterium]
MPERTDSDGPADPRGDGGSVRLRLSISYAGTDFAGWARQPGQRTVQGEIEAAIARVLRCPPVALTVAGRTDAGVHATGQVAHVDVPAGAWAASAPETLVRRLAGALPGDVRVRRARAADAGFDARFGALARHYVYRVTDAAWGVEPLRRTDILAWPRPLDLQRLNRAAELLVGEHDFAAYCRRREGASSRRELREFGWERAGGVLTAHVSANAFCHQMVRGLVGAVLVVGDGRRGVEWPAQQFALDRRSDAVSVAPPRGLTLERVDYPSPYADDD